MFDVLYTANHITILKVLDDEGKPHSYGLPGWADETLKTVAIPDEDTLAGMDGDLLLRVANTLVPPGESQWPTLPPDAARTIWTLLQTTKFPLPTFTVVGKPLKGQGKKKAAKKPKKELPVKAASTTNLAPGNDAPQQEVPMATKTKSAKSAKGKSAKAKAKKATKSAKSTNGLPKEGTKKDKLLKLVQRASGATMAEMLKTTGWKACRGTLGEVVDAAKQTLTMVKGEDGKASRWYAK